MHPKIAEQWHPIKNGDSKSDGYTSGSNIRVWWKCPKSDQHDWEASIKSRTRGSGCPSCSGNKVSPDNNLAAMHPKIAEQWHPIKNGDSKSDGYTSGSGKSVWWKCPKGEDHEWQTNIAGRVMGRGCPFCSGRNASKKNNLLILDPALAKEWHPTKNNHLKPENFTSGSGKSVWWKCPKGDDHEWKAGITTRYRGNGCPFCDGKRVSKTNNFAAMHPKIAEQWHPIKNGDSKSDGYTSGSHIRIWWKCPKSDQHDWEASIKSRTRGSGCPYCSPQTSAPEIRILCELKYLFDNIEVNWRNKIDGIEVDVYIPQIKIGFEYDGHYWHKDKKRNDLIKNKFLKEKGIELIRIREHPLKETSINDLIIKGLISKVNLNAIVLKIMTLLKTPLKINFTAYIKNKKFLNETEFNRYLSFLPSPPPEFSISSTHPKVSKEWHYHKNTPLKPENFTSGSGKSVWWKCPKGDDHEWQTHIANRTNGEGCPFCSGKRVSADNNLAAMHPKIAEQWHPNKNGDSKSDGYTSGSHIRIWWKCPKGHDYRSAIKERTRKDKPTGCPECSGNKVGTDNNLAAIFPEIAIEWHPTKNKNDKPEDFTHGSNRKVYWLCPKGHDYRSAIKERTRKNPTGCSVCLGKK